MKAILINSVNKTVTEVTLNDDEPILNQFYKLIGCDIIEIAHYINKNNSIIVDEEGLLKPQNHFFFYKKAHQPFAGNGLITGINENGDAVSCNISLVEAALNIEFLSREDWLRPEYYAN